MERIRLDVSLPRGPEHYWRMMCELTRKAGGFTISDIWGLSNGRSRKTIKCYVHACRDVSAIEPSAETADKAVVWRVVNLNAPAPVMRRPDYQDRRGRVQQQIWTTIRSLPQFTIRELAVEASTDVVRVPEGQAKDYLAALLKAGYIDTIRPSRKLIEPGIFRLKLGMGTGPLAPAILKARFVFDRNTNKPVGAAKAEACA